MIKPSVWTMLRTGVLAGILALAVACAPAASPDPGVDTTAATPPAVDAPDVDADATPGADADADADATPGADADADADATPGADADANATPGADADANATPGADADAMPGEMTAVSEDLCTEIQDLLEAELSVTFERTASAPLQDEEGFEFGEETGEGCLLIARGATAELGEPTEIDSNFEQVMTDAGWHEVNSDMYAEMIGTVGTEMPIYQLGPQLLFVTSAAEADESVLRIFVVNQPAGVPGDAPATDTTPDTDATPEADEEDAVATPEAEEEDAVATPEAEEEEAED